MERRMSRGGRVAVFFLILVSTIVPSLARAADPDALKKIVQGFCVPSQSARSNPAPCRLVDLANHYAVLKDINGRTQYLLIPTDTVSGIESPELLAPNALNYWEDAWQARRFVEEAARQPIPRTSTGLAVNSQRGRSQNELHIHVDCVRPDVVRALRRAEASVGNVWRPLPGRISGHAYLARRIEGTDLSQVNPFRLLADGVPKAKADMGDQTLVVIGATFKDGRDGFYLLNDHVDTARGNFASGEELLDHSCAILAPNPP